MRKHVFIRATILSLLLIIGVPFGGHIFGEHACGEHTLGEYAISGYTSGVHTLSGYTSNVRSFSWHGFGEHTLAGAPSMSRVVRRGFCQAMIRRVPLR